MKILTFFNHFTWKQVGLISFTFLLITAGIYAQNAMRTPTHTITKAGIINPTPTPLSPIVYPLNSPTITRLEPWFGKPGDTVRLRGTNFGNQQWQSLITVNDSPAIILNWSNQAIDLKLPQTTSGLLILIRGDQQSLTLPVSIYQSLSDPQLYFGGGKMWLKNLTLPAILTINSNQEFSLSPSLNQEVTTLEYVNLIHASLRDDFGQFLPLGLPPETLLIP